MANFEKKTDAQALTIDDVEKKTDRNRTVVPVEFPICLFSLPPLLNIPPSTFGFCFCFSRSPCSVRFLRLTFDAGEYFGLFSRLRRGSMKRHRGQRRKLQSFLTTPRKRTPRKGAETSNSRCSRNHSPMEHFLSDSLSITRVALAGDSSSSSSSNNNNNNSSRHCVKVRRNASTSSVFSELASSGREEHAEREKVSNDVIPQECEQSGRLAYNDCC